MTTRLSSRVVRVLDQDEVWTADGKNVLIADMSESYRGNVIRWLERQAGGLLWDYQTYLVERFLYGPMAPSSDSMAYDSLEASLDEGWEAAIADPMKWLHGTKLVTALSGGANAA